MAGRPCVGGDGRVPNRHMRVSVAYAEKKRCIEHFLKERRLDDAIYVVFGDPDDMRSKKKQVRKWIKNRVAIFAMCANGKSSHRKLRHSGTATLLSKGLEEQIVLWINSMRRDGMPVSLNMLRAKGVEIAKEMSQAAAVFRGSYSWAKKFMRRHRLSIRTRTRQGQTTPADAEKAALQFSARVHRTIVEHGITQVFNADQTAVCFEYLPRRTIDHRGVKTVWIKCAGKEKERATAMLLGDSQGNKYSPFLVFKSKPSRVPATKVANDEHRHGFGRRVWKEIKGLQEKSDCVIYGNENAWWASKLSLTFLRYFFADRQNIEDPVLLLWDDFSGHWTQEVVHYAESINVLLMKVPPRYTYVCQPADIAWNKPLKDRLRERWVEQMKRQIRDHHLQEERQKVTQNEDALAAQQMLDMSASICSGEIGEGREFFVPEAYEAREAVCSGTSDSEDDMIAQPTQSQRQTQDSRSFQLRAPTRTDTAIWISEAWHDLTPCTIQNGFKRVGLLNDTRRAPEIQTNNQTDMSAVIDCLRALQLQGRSRKMSAVDSDDDAANVYSDDNSNSELLFSL